MILKALVVISILFASQALAANKSPIPLLTYHLKPPFIVDEKTEQGLFYDLAKFLTKRSGRYQFVTSYIPRKRLDYLLQQDELKGLVVGANPIWFKDKNEAKYLWLDTIYKDRDEFVSLKSNAFEFEGFASLTGLSIAGVSGYYYFGVNDMVSKGQAVRVNTIGERQVLAMIRKKRAHVGIVSTSVFNYLRRHEGLPNIFHFSAQPHDAYDRRIFTSKENRTLFEHLKPIVSTMSQDPDWQKLIAKYQ